MRLLTAHERVAGPLQNLQWLPTLLLRLGLGVMFFQTGLGKLQHLPRTIQYFESLGIPAPALQAPFVAGVELLGGALLILGLGTRLAALLLAIVMSVAIVTAQLPELLAEFGQAPLAFSGELLSLSESLYLFVLLWLVSRGAQWISLDWLLLSRLRRATRPGAMDCSLAGAGSKNSAEVSHKTLTSV